jgi:FkbM family methyltransferase
MKQLLKSAYNAIPLKKDVYTVLKKIWTPPESIFKHLHFKDIFRVNSDADHSFLIRHYGFAIENEIFWKGLNNGWESVSMSLWTKLCKQSNVIFDIGANTGVYGLIAKSLNPASDVHAFEPVKRVYEKLSANCKLNGYNITCNEMAASDLDGTATIYDLNGEHILSVTVNKNLHDPNRKVFPTQIETIKLSTYIEKKSIEQIDLMKIDVETHEFEVLKGMATYLNKFRPTMLIEILEDEVGKNVESLIKDMGYLYFNIDEDNGIRQVDSITKSDYFNYLLCNEQVAAELKLL